MVVAADEGVKVADVSRRARVDLRRQPRRAGSVWIPAGLKRLILPLWNGSHRVARRASEILGALRHRRFGFCTVCGRHSLWLYRPRVIGPRLVELWGLSPRLAEALARKESSDCLFCGVKLRARRLATVLLEVYPVGEPPRPARSVAAWVKSVEARRWRVAEINHVDGLHKVLNGLPALAYSDFSPGAAPGAWVNGVPSEDLTRLTYPDNAFDLVLTSETLEHVPDLEAALREIRRVLVPGGRHLFTIPMLPGVSRTYPRMTIDAEGCQVAHAVEIRHPGGDVGYPVFTEFGADLVERLHAAGFEAEVRFGPTTEDDLAQVYVTRKPHFD